MTSISNIQQIVAVIRQQLATRATPLEPRLRRGEGAAGAAAKSPPKDIAALIGQRIKAIDRDDPNRGRKTFRVFVESILLSEFGEDLINDSQFYRIVDDVQQQMETDPATQASVATATQELVKQA
jgi:hypothetical protein